MPSDPRCPRCNGKVSARAAWCMHCGADIQVPGERGVAAVRSGKSEGTLARLVRSFDRNDGTRQVLSILVTVPVLIVLVTVGALRGGVGIALVGAVALGVYFRLCGSARRIVVHGAYGTAALIGCIHLVATDLGSANLPGELFHGPVLLLVALLLAAGWWTDQRVPTRH
ncbi:hypothetical protein SAMN05216559_0568 [Halomicrobium zhouii]|uniref:Zinc-ribbon domain-containing protein n=1 Tax=Halomicrobium zhouii TaxID=767519 RepID=A0A1I6KDV2_9EURY|nr:hypothetical protein [Halomicrobium zhouii]SFR89040.1 hypothetical protein SAMN05216559_0568 [Halomicrobium zhouii]